VIPIKLASAPLRLLGPSAWWLPARLARLRHRLGLHEEESSPRPPDAMPGAETSSTRLIEDYALLSDLRTAALVHRHRLHRLVLLPAFRLGRLFRSVARTPRARPLGCGSIEWRRAEAALSRWIARARDSVGDHRREDSPPRFLASGEERPDALLSCGPAVSAFEVAAGDRVSLTLSWFPAHALRAATADRVAAVRETVAVLARLVGAVDLRRAVPHPDRDPPRSAVASLVISA
jgi:hypothetical protein